MTSMCRSMRAAINIANVATARLLPDGTLTGRAIDLAGALAVRLNLLTMFVHYESANAILAAGERDEWDIAFIASDPSRDDRYFFTKPYLAIDATCAVAATSSTSANEELDAPGIRIASVDGTGYGLQLRRTFGLAEIVPSADAQGSVDLLISGAVEAVAGTRSMLEEAAGKDQTIRVLTDDYATLGQAIATPQRRNEFIAALTAFQNEF